RLGGHGSRSGREAIRRDHGCRCDLGGLHRRPGPRRSARRSLSTPPWSIPRERQLCCELTASSICLLPALSRWANQPRPERKNHARAWTPARSSATRDAAMRPPVAAFVLALVLVAPPTMADEAPSTDVTPLPPPRSPARFSVLPEQWQRDTPPSEEL